MMVNSDYPIIGKRDDKLNRACFSKSLAKMICSISRGESITIGLHGRWGSGKTSVINMTLETIGELAKQADGSVPLIVKFEPWNYIDDQQLMFQFFRLLTSSLSIQDSSAKMKAAGKVLEDYAEAARFLEIVPTVGIVFKAVNSISGRAGTRLLQKGQNSEKNLAEMKQKVSKALSELDTKLVVVIDDVDRLTNSQIRMIFQLVSSIAKFPNVIYLLSFDRKVVCRALESVQECDGEEYLEKIIQFPISLPEAKKSQISDILSSELDKLCAENPPAFFSRDRWQLLYLTCIDPLINTIRDARRFMNTFSMLYQTLRGEIDFADLAVVAALQIWEPALCAWLYENSSHLCGSASLPPYGLHRDNAVDDEKALKDSLQIAIGDAKMDYAISVIKCLFPKGDLLFGGYHSDITGDDLFAQGRVAHSQCFEQAFCMCLEGVFFSKAHARDALTDSNADELTLLFHEYARTGLLKDLASYLNGSFKSIPPSRYSSIIEAIFRSLGKAAEPAGGLLGFSADKVLIHIVEAMLHDLGDENTVAVFERTFPMLDADNTMAFAVFLNSQELDQGRYGEGRKGEEGWAISSDSLDIAEQQFVKSMRRLSAEENLFERADSRFAIEVWGKIDKDFCGSYVAQASKATDLAIAMNVASKAREGLVLNTLSEPFWGFSDTLTCSDEARDAFEAIDRLRMTEAFWVLSPRDQEKIAAYYLAFEQNGVDADSVPATQAREAVEAWRKEFEELSCRLDYELSSDN